MWNWIHSNVVIQHNHTLSLTQKLLGIAVRRNLSLTFLIQVPPSNALFQVHVGLTRLFQLMKSLIINSWSGWGVLGEQIQYYWISFSALQKIWRYLADKELINLDYSDLVTTCWVNTVIWNAMIECPWMKSHMMRHTLYVWRHMYGFSGFGLTSQGISDNAMLVQYFCLNTCLNTFVPWSQGGLKHRRATVKVIF